MSSSNILLALLVITILAGQPATGKVGDRCRSADDCDLDECCAGVSAKITGICQLQPQLNDTCVPKIMPGAKICPCAVGTTCGLVHSRKVNALKRRMNLKIKDYYECVALPTQEEEYRDI